MNKQHMTLEEKYFHAARAMMADRWRGRRDDNLQKRILVILKGQDKALKSDIAFALHIPAQHLTEALEKMEKDGLVFFTGEETEQMVRLTEKGMEQAIQPEAAEPHLLDCLDEEERAMLEVALDKVLDAAKGSGVNSCERHGHRPMGMGDMFARFMMGGRPGGQEYWNRDYMADSRFDCRGWNMAEER